MLLIFNVWKVDCIGIHFNFFFQQVHPTNKTRVKIEILKLLEAAKDPNFYTKTQKATKLTKTAEAM